MKRKLIFTVISSIILIGLLAVSVFVALHQQDIRQQAHKQQEFLQVTPAEIRTGDKAQFSVVVTNLDANLSYRLGLHIRYEKREGKVDANNPLDLNKTLKISESKTYKFTFPMKNCNYQGSIKVELFSRSANERWSKADKEGATNVKLDCPADTEKTVKDADKENEKRDDDAKKSPAASARSNASPTAKSSVNPTPSPSPFATPQPSPDIQPSPSDVLGAANSNLSDPDTDAIDITTLENFSVIEEENKSLVKLSEKEDKESKLQKSEKSPAPSTLVSPSLRHGPSPSLSSRLLSPSPAVSPKPQSSPTNSLKTTATPSPLASSPSYPTGSIANGIPSTTPVPSTQTQVNIIPSPSSLTVQNSSASPAINQTLVNNPNNVNTIIPTPVNTTNYQNGGGFGGLITGSNLSQLVTQIKFPSPTPLRSPASELAKLTPSFNPEASQAASASTQALASGQRPSSTPEVSPEINQPAQSKGKFPWILMILGVGAVVLTSIGIVLLL